MAVGRDPLFEEALRDDLPDARQEDASADSERKPVPGPSFLPGEPTTVEPQTPNPPQLAYEKRILDRFAEAIRLQGVVGESATVASVYLALTSRLLDKPISLGVKGNSASGKSYAVGKAADFFPDEAVIAMTGMSEKALIYLDEDYAHRTIVLYEAEGLRETAEDDHTAYFVRSLLSEGRLDYRVTVRDPEGGWTTKTISREGPTNIIFTTTRTRVHYENETRVLSLTTDDSSDQTARILAQLAVESDESADLGAWRELQSWLQNANNRVTIPFAHRLADLVPSVAVRLRRDFEAVLGLIRAHTLLHQVTREADGQGRVVATLEDYEVVRGLIADVVSAGVGSTVPDIVRETVAAVQELHDDQGITARTLGRSLKLDRSATYRRLQMAADGDYVRNLEERKGRPGRWVPGSPLPEDVQILPSVEALSGSTVAETPTAVATAESRSTSGIEDDDSTVARPPEGKEGAGKASESEVRGQI